MSDDLFSYYNAELAAIRQLGREFADAHPQEAGSLTLKDLERAPDPHVERLIEAVAFLTARVRSKIDDEFPELTQALLNVLYPHYLAPIPSMAIVQFVVDPSRGKLTTGHLVKAGETVATNAARGLECRFRTCYPVKLWPFELAAAAMEQPRDPFPQGSEACIVLTLACRGVKVEEMKGPGDKPLAPPDDSIRFFINEDDISAQRIYESLFNHLVGVDLRSPGAKRPAVQLSAAAVRPVGFGDSDGLLSYPNRSFLGYRLLQEYFAFPQKFLFFDIACLRQAAEHRLGEGIEIRLYLRRSPRLDRPLSPSVFRMGATPIVNLFEAAADPVRVSHERGEYRLIPDRRREESHEVYRVLSVRSVSTDRSASEVLAPLYQFQHEIASAPPSGYWYADRRVSERPDDPGTDVYLALVDATRRALPPVQTLEVQVECTNRDLPALLELRGATDQFFAESAVPARIECLVTPTSPIRSHMGSGVHWQLISHLALSYLSLVEDGGESLREMLRLYNFSSDAAFGRANQAQIDGISNLSTKRVVRRPKSMPWNGFCRGLEVTVDFDATRFSAGTPFLFASVLEAFLGLYASINSFTQFVATVGGGSEILRRWPPRAGEQILL